MIYESNLIEESEHQLRQLLANLPVQMERHDVHHAGADLLVRLGEGDRRWTLVCEVKSNGQPRLIREAAFQARDYAQRMTDSGAVYPVVMAPFISTESGSVCRDLGVGYADLAGNCRLAFGSVYIEKSVAKNPFNVKRELRSLFAPKSARVLRIMLEHPLREWKVAELADRAHISYGQVSKVRKHLLDREWALGKWGGVRISKPQALLAEWAKVYVPLRKARHQYYTLLHGEELQNAIRSAFRSLLEDKPRLDLQNRHLLLNSFSASRWLAPYVKIAGEFFYADTDTEAVLKRWLHLEPALKGENITIDIAGDEGVFQEDLEPAPGLFCTGLIQTYLDLAAAGERGAEAAAHLYDERIAPRWRDSQ